MSFSGRAGLTPPRPLQRASMDGPLRNGLWNVVEGMLQSMETGLGAFMRLGSYGPSPGYSFLERVWVDFRGAARDMFQHVNPLTDLRQWFYAAQWNEVYDLLEFMASLLGHQALEDACNVALEKHKSAYRMVDGRIIELTDEQQLAALEQAVAAAASLPAVYEHLRTALERLADRPEPDCRNAMNEAISAVETLVGVISDTPGTTLDAGLKSIQSRALLPVHPSLLKSWGALYGYASDAGVRHGMKPGQPALTLDDALYLVVSCSALVTYLLSLARKAGMALA